MKIVVKYTDEPSTRSNLSTTALESFLVISYCLYDNIFVKLLWKFEGEKKYNSTMD